MKQEVHILTEVKRIVTAVQPEAKVYLYGSRAKGIHGKDSDWDLLILLTADRISPELERSITDPLYDLEFETGEIISPMVYPEKEWHDRHHVTPYYQNVMREGRLL